MPDPMYRCFPVWIMALQLAPLQDTKEILDKEVIKAFLLIEVGIKVAAIIIKMIKANPILINNKIILEAKENIYKVMEVQVVDLDPNKDIMDIKGTLEIMIKIIINLAMEPMMAMKDLIKAIILKDKLEQ